MSYISVRKIPKQASKSADSQIPTNICGHLCKNENPFGEKESLPAAENAHEYVMLETIVVDKSFGCASCSQVCLINISINTEIAKRQWKINGQILRTSVFFVTIQGPCYMYSEHY